VVVVVGGYYNGGGRGKAHLQLRQGCRGPFGIGAQAATCLTPFNFSCKTSHGKSVGCQCVTPAQELPQAYRSTLTTPTSTSSSSIDQPPAAAAAAADGEDAFLMFSVKFRPREGGGEQVVNEISHFRKVDGQWLYFNEVDV
jgi:hypothetical protein